MFLGTFMFCSLIWCRKNGTILISYYFLPWDEDARERVTKQHKNMDFVIVHRFDWRVYEGWINQQLSWNCSLLSLFLSRSLLSLLSLSVLCSILSGKCAMWSTQSFLRRKMKTWTTVMYSNVGVVVRVRRMWLSIYNLMPGGASQTDIETDDTYITSADWCTHILRLI